MSNLNSFNLNHQPEIISQPVFQHSSEETYVLYKRSDKHQVTMTLLHELFSGHAPELIIATNCTTNPDFRLAEQVILTLPEARLLRGLLNRPEIVAFLDDVE